MGGVIIGDSLAISRQSNCRQLSHFAICRQSKCRQSINRLSTFLPPPQRFDVLTNGDQFAHKYSNIWSGILDAKYMLQNIWWGIKDLIRRQMWNSLFANIQITSGGPSNARCACLTVNGFCSNCKMYLSKLLNAFVQSEKCICKKKNQFVHKYSDHEGPPAHASL